VNRSKRLSIIHTNWRCLGREDVLNEISPDMLDKIAYRFHADNEKNLSAYERLLKDEKRKKMDYLRTQKPEVDYDERNRG